LLREKCAALNQQEDCSLSARLPLRNERQWWATGPLPIGSVFTAGTAVKDVAALPLLSYTLDDMWTQMVHREDSTLRLPAQSFELGGVLVERVNKFLAERPGAEDALRRVLTLRRARTSAVDARTTHV
jgi:hypothetical protein